MTTSALVEFVKADVPNDVIRHHEGPHVPLDVWDAQADAFSSHLVNRLVDVIVEEIKGALGNPICLHQALAGLSEIPDQLCAHTRAAVIALVAATQGGA